MATRDAAIQLAPELLFKRLRIETMDALLITATLAGSFLGAFALQKAALEGLFRIMDAERRGRQ
jgi:hypothetical protein